MKSYELQSKLDEMLPENIVPERFDLVTKRGRLVRHSKYSITIVFPAKLYLDGEEVTDNYSKFEVTFSL